MISICEVNSQKGSRLGTRKGKGILAGAIIATVVAAVVIVPLSIAGYLTFLDACRLHSQ